MSVNRIKHKVNHVSLVVDKSGSMRQHEAQLVRVVDEFVKGLQEESDRLGHETRISLYAFDHEVQNLVWDMDVKHLPSLQGLYEVNNGATALIEAAVKSIDDLKNIWEGYGEHSFLQVVVTDGEENASGCSETGQMHIRMGAGKGTAVLRKWTGRIQSAMDWALTLEIDIDNLDGTPGLHASVALPAGPAQTLLVPLQATAPQLFGMRAGVPMPMSLDGQRVLIAPVVTGELQRNKVGAVRIYLNAPKAAQDILVGRFGTRSGGDELRKAYTGIIDAYGQSTRSDWPEKVRSVEQLANAWKAEGEQLKKWQAQAQPTDTFGGLLEGPDFQATGFFRTEKRNGRWWLVTPDGHPYWSLGVNTVNSESIQTYVEGREYMFTELPAEGEPLADFYGQSDDRDGVGAQQGRAFGHGRWYDFYAANRYRATGGLSGQPAADAWLERTLARLDAWGFNGLGNWSQPAFAGASRIPYSLPLAIGGDYATVSTGYDWWGAMPDPFDPKFAMAA